MAEIGFGTYGRVFKAISRKGDEEVFALKKLHLEENNNKLEFNKDGVNGGKFGRGRKGGSDERKERMDGREGGRGTGKEEKRNWEGGRKEVGRGKLSRGKRELGKREEGKGEEGKREGQEEGRGKGGIREGERRMDYR